MSQEIYERVVDELCQSDFQARMRAMKNRTATAADWLETRMLFRATCYQILGRWPTDTDSDAIMQLYVERAGYDHESWWKVVCDWWRGLWGATS
jgi:hypothetical protein